MITLKDLEKHKFFIAPKGISYYCDWQRTKTATLADNYLLLFEGLYPFTTIPDSQKLIGASTLGMINKRYYFRPSQVSEFTQIFKLSPLSRDREKTIGKNSIWRNTNENEIVLIGEQYLYGTLVKIPKDKDILVSNPKSFLCYDTVKYYKVKIDNKDYVIPKQCFMDLELHQAGIDRSFWRIYDKNGKLIKSKKFADLGKVKASVRVTTGVAKEDPNADNIYNEYIAGPNNNDLKFDDWKAIKFNSNNEQLEVVELKDWYFETILKF